MGIIKSKQEKELEKKLLIRKTTNEMKRHIEKLEQQKTVYIDAAKRAMKAGLPTQVNLAVSGLRLTMAHQKKAQEMLLNFEITSQMKDMSMMTTEFLGGMSTLSKEMIKLTDNKEFLKVQQQFETAMSGVEAQTEQMDVFLDMNQSTFKSAGGDANTVSDAEVRSLIGEQVAQDAIGSDNDMDFDAEIEKIKKKLASEI